MSDTNLGFCCSVVVGVAAALTGALIASTPPGIVQVGTFDPTLSKPAAPVRTEGTVFKGAGFNRRDVYFPSGDPNGVERLHGWFYTPATTLPNGRSPPVVLMASGLGAQMDFGMDAYAEVFAQNGFAALLFDYRCFGSSDGTPRNWVDPWRHLDDWRAALKTLAPGGKLADEVDTSKLGLWGSSMSGGHVLVIASELADPATTPAGNRKKNMKPPPEGRGILGALTISLASLCDIARSVTFQPPAYIPIVGAVGSVSLMPLPKDELHLYFRKHPAQRGGGWQNMAPARLALRVGFYSPIDFVPNITAPTLFVAADQDTLCPASVVRDASKLVGGNTAAEFLTLNCGHFGTYYDANFDQASEKMSSFFFSKFDE